MTSVGFVRKDVVKTLRTTKELPIIHVLFKGYSHWFVFVVSMVPKSTDPVAAITWRGNKMFNSPIVTEEPCSRR